MQMKIRNKERTFWLPRPVNESFSSRVARSNGREASSLLSGASGVFALKDGLLSGHSKPIYSKVIAMDVANPRSLDRKSPTMKKGSSIESLVRKITMFAKRPLSKLEVSSPYSPAFAKKSRQISLNFENVSQPNIDVLSPKIRVAPRIDRGKENLRTVGNIKILDRSLASKLTEKVAERVRDKAGSQNREKAENRSYAEDRDKEKGVSRDRSIGGSKDRVKVSKLVIGKRDVRDRSPGSGLGRSMGILEQLMEGKRGVLKERVASSKGRVVGTPGWRSQKAESFFVVPRKEGESARRSLEKRRTEESERRRVDIRSEDKEVKREGEKNAYFLRLAGSLGGRAEVRALSEEIQRAFEEFEDSDSAGVFEFGTRLGFYRLGESVGKGCFGRVYRAEQLLTGATVALKAISKRGLRDRSSRAKVDREVSILKRVSGCQGVIRLFEVFEDADCVFMVFEYARRGDLVRFFQTRPLLEEPQLRIFFRRVAEAARSLHRVGVVHRDLKLENILLDENFEPKICDFGISTLFDPEKPIKDTGGTPVYLAPEVILAEGNVGPKTDVWSLGVLLYLMLFGYVPFRANDVQVLYQKILLGHFRFEETDVGSPELRHLISSMLRVDPAARLSLDQVLEHEWLASPESKKQDPLPLPESAEKGIFLFLESLGFPRAYIQQSLSQKSFNHVSACFEALAAQFRSKKSHLSVFD